MSLLAVNHVSKTYYSGFLPFFKGRVVDAVKNLSLDISQGKCLGVVGESGCGKTTLGKIILGLEAPDEGQVIFQGKNLYQLSRRELRMIRKDLQAVFQDYSSAINPKYPVKAAVSEPLRNYVSLTQKEEDMRVRELFELVGLNENDLNKHSFQFSGGQLQRINIARAVALNPRLIVLDEAISSLDTSVQAQILNLLLDLKKKFNLSYLFISHDIEAICYLADSLAVMYLGQIIEIIKDISLFKEFKHPYTKKLISSVLIANPSCRTDLSLEFDELRKDIYDTKGCAYKDRCGDRTNICCKTKPELKEIAPGHKAACHLF